MLTQAKHLDIARTARFIASLRMTIGEKGFSAKLRVPYRRQNQLATSQKFYYHCSSGMIKVYGGLDPAGDETRASGAAMFDATGQVLAVAKLFRTQEILAFIQKFSQQLCCLGIDGPCGLPRGLRHCCFGKNPDCAHSQAEGVHGREAERLLAQRGIGCFFTTKGSFVKPWVLRCIELHETFRKLRIPSIEVYPYATKRLLLGQRPPRKNTACGKAVVVDLLRRHGLRDEMLDQRSHHEHDALLAALTAKLFCEDHCEKLGNAEEGFIYIPKG